MSGSATQGGRHSLPVPVVRSAQPGLARPAAQAAIARWLPVVLLYSCFVPAGLSFEVGELRFFAFRVVLVASLPILAYLIYSNRPRVLAADCLVAAAAGWALIAFMVNRGFLDGLQSGGRYALDMLASYLIARTCIRSETDLRHVLIAVLPGLLLCGAALAVEAVTGRFRIIDLFPLEEIGGSLNQQRLGLLRAFGPFSHAILGGLFMSSFAPLYFYAFRDARTRTLGVASGLTGFFTVSTAGIANIALQLVMVAYRSAALLFGLRRDWRAFVLGFAALIVVIEILTEGSAAAWIISYLALDERSGFYRLVIWEFGTRSVMANPVFGIGYDHYAPRSWVGESIDNHWLFIAVRFGLPQLLLMGGAVVYLLMRLGRISAHLPTAAGNPFTGVFVTLFCLTLAGISVAFFNEFLVFFLFLVGVAASLIEAFDGRRRAASLHARHLREAENDGSR